MDELLGRKTPHSAPAEQAVLGSMLIDSRCIPDVLEKLKPDEFYIQLNRDIYETIYAMFSYSMAIDPVTVLGQMKVRGVYQDNCEEYLAELMRVTPTAANVMEYAQIVRDRALLRRLAETADEINNMVYEGAGEADAIKTMNYTIGLQKYQDNRYNRLYLADVDDLFVCNLDDGITPGSRLMRYRIIQDQRREFYREAIKRQLNGK